MIVVDTNVVAYLFIPGAQTPSVRQLLAADPVWAAPVLWRSEFRSVLAGYLRQRQLSVGEAGELMEAAVQLIGGREFPVDSDTLFEMVRRSRCSAYDCEFAAVARQLDVPLVTADKQLLQEFPSVAVSIASYL